MRFLFSGAGASGTRSVHHSGVYFDTLAVPGDGLEILVGGNLVPLGHLRGRRAYRQLSVLDRRLDDGAHDRLVLDTVEALLRTAQAHDLHLALLAGVRYRLCDAARHGVVLGEDGVDPTAEAGHEVSGRGARLVLVPGPVCLSRIWIPWRGLL